MTTFLKYNGTSMVGTQIFLPHYPEIIAYMVKITDGKYGAYEGLTGLRITHCPIKASEAIKSAEQFLSQKTKDEILIHILKKRQFQKEAKQ